MDRPAQVVLTVPMGPQAPAERLEPPVTVDHRAVAGLPEAQGLTVPAGRRALPALPALTELPVPAEPRVRQE